MYTKPDILDIVRNMFNPDPHRGTGEIMLFVIATLLFVGFGNSLYQLVWDASLAITGFEGEARWRGALVVLVLAATGLVLSIWRMYRIQLNRYRVTSQLTELNENRTAARGLILLLSSYYARNNNHPRIDDFIDKIEDKGYSSYRTQVLQSNWGTLAAATEYHRKNLERVWFVCSSGERGSADQVQYAERLVKAILASFRDVKAGEIIFDHDEVDPYSVQDSARVVSTFYQKIFQILRWDPWQVMADFTGGTSAMSGGVQLAALTQGYPVQYLRQDRAEELLATDDIETAAPFTNIALSYKLVPKSE